MVVYVCVWVDGLVNVSGQMSACLSVWWKQEKELKQNKRHLVSLSVSINIDLSFWGTVFVCVCQVGLKQHFNVVD